MPKLPDDLQLGSKAILSATIMKNLCGREQNARKTAAVEIEALVKNLNGQKDLIQTLVKFLVSRFIEAASPQWRKGGVAGLAAVAISITTDKTAHFELIVPPVIKTLLAKDARVRFHAIEAMYNIASAGRNIILPWFNSLFTAISQLVGGNNNDDSVTSALTLLNSCLQEIISETTTFNLSKFIPILEKQIFVTNPHVRLFLINWILRLDSIPHLNLISFIPSFLDGLFLMLSDPMEEVRVRADAALGEFLQELKTTSIAWKTWKQPLSSTEGSVAEENSSESKTNLTTSSTLSTSQSIDENNTQTPASAQVSSQNAPPTPHDPQVSSSMENSSSNDQNLFQSTNIKRPPLVRFDRIINVVCAHSSSAHPFTQMTGLIWMNEFIILAGADQLQTHIPTILHVLLPCLSHQAKGIRLWASTTNANLLLLVEIADKSKIDISYTIEIIFGHLSSPLIPTREAALRWTAALYQRMPDQLIPLFLTDTKSSPSQNIVKNVTNNKIISHKNLIPPKPKEFAFSSFPKSKNIFNILVHTITDPSEHISLISVEVLSTISAKNELFFQQFIDGFLRIVYHDRNLLKTRASFILRHISLIIPPEKLFLQISNQIDGLFAAICKDLDFSDNQVSTTLPTSDNVGSLSKTHVETSQIRQSQANQLAFLSIIVNTMNIILVTADVFANFRQNLIASLGANVSVGIVNKKLKKKLFSSKSSSNDLVAQSSTSSIVDTSACLYSLLTTWSHSPSSLLTLCLLTGAYYPAWLIVKEFSQMEISVHFLVEIDKLVQLLESPAFTHVRIQILEPFVYPYLIKTLYGLLMLLPQSSVFHLLQNRLNAANPFTLMGNQSQQKIKDANQNIDQWNSLIENFVKVQSFHQSIQKEILALHHLRTESASEVAFQIASESHKKL